MAASSNACSVALSSFCVALQRRSLRGVAGRHPLSRECRVASTQPAIRPTCISALQSGGRVHTCRDRIDRGWRIATAQHRFRQWNLPGADSYGHVRTSIAAPAFQRMQGQHAAPVTFGVTTTKRLFEPERCGRIGRNRNTVDAALQVVGRVRDGAPAHLPTVIPPGPPLDPSPAPGSPRHPTAPVGPAGSWRSCAAPAHHRR